MVMGAVFGSLAKVVPQVEEVVVDFNVCIMAIHDNLKKLAMSYRSSLSKLLTWLLVKKFLLLKLARLLVLVTQSLCQRSMLNYSG